MRTRPAASPAPARTAARPETLRYALNGTTVVELCKTTDVI